MTEKTQKKMFLGMAITDGYGNLHGAWRAPKVDPNNYADFDANVRYAQAAERGKFAFLFTPDFPAVRGNLEHSTTSNVMDPMMTLATIARETERIGLVATGSTTFQEPFNQARQFKALDVMSRGRAGWNAVTTSDPAVAANYGKPVAERSERYQRAHESIQVVQGLWGSWEQDAWIKDQTGNRFIDSSKLRPINMQGAYVASRGPLAIPPSEQGQPVIFSSGHPTPQMLSLVGRYSSAFIAAVWTLEEAREQRAMVRNAAAEAGRDPDEVKYIAGIMTTVAPTVREGLDRRIAIGGDIIESRIPYMGAMLGLDLDPAMIDRPLTPQQLAQAHASRKPTREGARLTSGDPRSGNVLDVARQGWSLRDILAHGVIDYHPTTVGPAEVHADHLQEWFEAGAADGFWVSPDVYEDGIDAFVDEVIPVLQERGIYPTDYEGATLRDHLGVPAQYGIDPRIAGDKG